MGRIYKFLAPVLSIAQLKIGMTTGRLSAQIYNVGI
jgi:hypothetical protein